MLFQIKLLSENATVPTRGSLESAGYDLYAAKNTEIQPKERGVVHTDISMIIPFSYYGRIAPRSSLALYNGIDVGAGVVDSDYRGPVNIILFNHSNKVFRGF